jgi:E3 ubiquitin-protein ligase TRIP12
MPRLPSDGIFVIDNVVQRSSQRYNDAVLWQWRDDRNIWHAYTPIDSRIIEVKLDVT